jgi:hypothetical protein
MKAAVVPGVTSSPQEITLAGKSLWSAYCNPNEIRIECQEGKVWITQEGDHRDIILEAEQQYRVDKRGLVIVQAVGDARILVNYEPIGFGK